MAFLRPLFWTSCLLWALPACRGKDLSFDCEHQAARFEEEIDGQGELLAAIPDGGPYPVALILSDVGIDKLLDSTIDKAVPFTGELPFGPVKLMFEPESEPKLELLDYPGCVDCVVISLDFGVELQDMQGAISSGAGSVKMSIPIRLETKDDDAVTLIAGYDELQISELHLSVYGFDSDEHIALAGALRTLMEERIRMDYGPTPLLDLGSWQLGDGSVKLLAREVFVFPEERSLVLGMQTNLNLPSFAGLDKPVLPEGVPMGMLFDSAIFLAMSERMLAEGQIPQRYDRDGNVDPEGEFAVTLERMVASELQDDQLDTFFRVWRIAGGYCGYARALMGLDLALVGSKIVVTPGKVAVLEGEGVGAVAAEDKELVEDHQNVVDKFKRSLADQVAITVNYDSLALEGSTIIFQPLELTVDPAGVTTHLDFIVVANE